ncbi:AMP-binding protein [Rubrimonas cliftonensis]|uniref:AMP-binding protein n=1 Tax=Rubrimonas cliftonensis TaxID=89524 RepID=UPI003CCB9DDA
MSHQTPEDACDTFAKLLDRNAAVRGDRPAAREKALGVWASWTWAEAREEVRALAMGLRELGLAPGDRVAVVGTNRPQLYWSMIASQCCGAQPVPLYQDSVADEMAYVLDHAEVRFAVVEDQEQVDKLLAIADRLPMLERILYLDPRGLRRYDHGRLTALSEAQAKGREHAARLEPEINAVVAAQTGAEPCVMLYTSGTTGKPKGVVLSYDNILKTSRASAAFDGLTDRDSILAYLPMAWVGDFIFSMGQAYVTGFCVACPESAETMMTDLREIGPSYFFAPPRIFETLLTSVTIRMEDAGPIKKRLFDHFIGHARRVGCAILDGRPVSTADRLWYRVGEALVYGPLKNALGMSRIRVGYTAGEAIGPEIFEFYRSLGVNLKQLYGQTEASVFITQQPDGAVRADTVGVPSPGVELRIGESGEVFYRSPGVFMEYYRNAEATAETKDAEGWVATGDAGFFEPDTGQLRIIDRAKDVGKLTSGALFAPKYVENKLKFFPDIKEAVSFGHGRDHVCAFVNIDLDSVGAWAERNNVAYASYQELAQHPRVTGKIAAQVAEANRSIASDPLLSACQVRRFLILHKELDPDDGEMTRTMKVRRRIIAERYQPLIDALYSDATEVFADVEVSYEDGRKGRISATVRIIDAETVEPAREIAA